MRTTTVTIDPDVEVLIERAMRETGAPFKQVLNDAVREGLRASSGKSKKAGSHTGNPSSTWVRLRWISPGPPCLPASSRTSN